MNPQTKTELSNSLLESTRNDFAEPALQLWFSVLQQAVDDIINPKSQLADRRCAWRWVNNRFGDKCFNSFDHVCVMLNIDAARVRLMLKRATVGDFVSD